MGGAIFACEGRHNDVPGGVTITRYVGLQNAERGERRRGGESTGWEQWLQRFSKKGRGTRALVECSLEVGIMRWEWLLAQTYPTLSEPESVGSHWSPDMALATLAMVGEEFWLFWNWGGGGSARWTIALSGWMLAVAPEKASFSLSV